MEKFKIPNYKEIFLDILKIKFPEKKKKILPLINKEKFSAEEILSINNQLYGETDKDKSLLNNKLHSYRESDILRMLDYQKKNNLNNTELANHFNLSRNTVAKWKKVFF
ncbi:DNA-binding transcriptional regulator YiaG [Chryseobacterium defluvii]|uniref:DNA-binding transcriptional regulator YiaG n=1 Tax=Chryseobacterium defluvii TaxID=160396 RepID=A0A840KEU2_9FLAO|nr:helix-turn-helix domain-containing protein [Chryseobacterium defluvii]MBB4807706.1 DNA-binding transcriptional regulator YiaG [Chryseobacterium defluvii]